MNTVSLSNIIPIAIVFLVAGIIFCIIAMYLGRPSSVQKAPISKPCSIIFYIIGALTVVNGIMALIFKDILTKHALQIAALLYLAAITVLLSVFSFLIKDVKGSDFKEAK